MKSIVKTLVRSSVGDTEFTVKVGLYQGSVLSPYLFDLIMDVIAEKAKDPLPWSMIFDDDIVLCGRDRSGGKDRKIKESLGRED